MRTIFAVLAPLFLLTSCGARYMDPAESSRTSVGDPVPAFTLTTLDGKVVDSSKLQGKVVLLNFFATWCRPCRIELPRLQTEVWDQFKSNPDFVLVIVGREHTSAELQKFKDSTQYTMPMAPDPRREIYGKFAVQDIPRTYLIGRDGKIVRQSIAYEPGEFDAMKAALREQLESKKQ